MDKFSRFYLVVVLLLMFWVLWDRYNKPPEPPYCEKLLQKSVLYLKDDGRFEDSSYRCVWEKGLEFWRHQRKVLADSIDPASIQARLNWYADQEKLLVEGGKTYRPHMAELKATQDRLIKELELTNPLAAQEMRDRIYLKGREEALEKEREVLSLRRSKEYFLDDVKKKQRLLRHVDNQIHELENGRPWKPCLSPDGTSHCPKPIPRP